MRRHWAVLLYAILWCALPGAAKAAETLYAATSGGGRGGGTLYTVNPSTAVATPAGTLLASGTPVGITGLAFHPLTGVLYGVTSTNSPTAPNSLVTINTATAAVTVIGSLGQVVTDISFQANGTLFGWTKANRLVTINLTTGVATNLPLGGSPSAQGGGLAFSPGGTLYVDQDGNTLDTVNPGTGGITTGPAIVEAVFEHGGVMNGLAFNAAGKLFGVNPSGFDGDGCSDGGEDGDGCGCTAPVPRWDLVTINTSTGVATEVGQLPDGTDAIAFSPADRNIGDAYLLSYIPNLLAGDSYVNITNAGTRNGFDPAGGVCANVYVFDPSEELVACCSCYVSPDGLRSLATQDLISNTLTPGKPNGIVIKLLGSIPLGADGATCDATTPTALSLEPGLRAWSTALHQNTTSSAYQVSENAFRTAVLSPSELQKLTTFCGFIKANGSTFGVCKNCRVGGSLGGSVR